MDNQRGGIISKLFIIPAGVALMVAFFFLGYYVGKYQCRSTAQVEVVPPLPDIVSKNGPKQEEFSFYKTLTDKGNKTISIDLKPKSSREESPVEKKSADDEAVRATPSQKSSKEKIVDVKTDKTPVSRAAKEVVTKKPQESSRKEPVAAVSSAKLRYTLQIASYQSKEMAEADVKKMKTKGYAAFIVSSQVPDKGTWHRVRLGSFTSRGAAEKLQKELQSKAGVTPNVVVE